MENVYFGGKTLRCGYTTGTCAHAASKAAVFMLLGGEYTENVSVVTPDGTHLELEINDITITESSVKCAVRKDGGDDVDVTHGMLIYASAEKIPGGTEICGGDGIGTVTKSGLDQPVGNAAINSVPRKMITEAVKEECERFGYDGGIRITISAPDGEKIAEKTYNPRMGIQGGISIIGTSGIVRPMSTAAIVETSRLEMNIRKNEGHKSLVLTLGNYGNDFLVREMPFINSRNVSVSNYIGDGIDSAIQLGFENVLLVGHIGKLVKLGGGVMNTHSSQADCRMDVLITCGVLAGEESSFLSQIYSCVTADSALEILKGSDHYDSIIDILMKNAQKYLDIKAKKMINVGAVMFSDRFGIIGETEKAVEIRKIIMEEYN